MRADRQAGRVRDLVHEVLNELRDVLAPLGQRRHAQRDDRQAMIEVLAEFARGDLRLDIATGRGNDAHIDRDLGRAADALEGLIDKHAQDLVLGLARHIGDFVDEQRAAVCLFERADLARLRAVGFGPEQLDFHMLGQHGSGVDDHEWPGRAVGARVDGARRRAPCRNPTSRRSGCGCWSAPTFSI